MHADRSSALDHCVGAFGEVLCIEVAVGVDELAHPCKDGAKVEEEQARAFLDDEGYLRPRAEVPFSRENAYLVFSQEGIVLDVGRWQAQATRFFQTRVGLALPKARASQGLLREEDAFLLLVELPNAPLAKRCILLRPRQTEDLALAERIESEKGSQGMSELAARCPSVCLVETEGPSDRAALTLAALAASICLGPIVPPTHDTIFGVRTARERLDAMHGSAYR
ncbi:MAG: hypothetical protein U0174_10390 [Polyangiaceae bacterium]